VQTCHLASAHIWTFEVRVKEKIEIEWYFFAWVINAYIHMQLFFPEKKIDIISKFQENMDTLPQKNIWLFLLYSYLTVSL